MGVIISDNLDRFSIDKRNWQGIPSIETTPDGTLYASWYSGGEGECHENYVIMHKSSDNGRSFSEPMAVVAPKGNIRAYDPAIFTDPQGNLRWYWAESYGMFDGKCGVWQSILGPEGFEFPTRICDGIMMNKPTIMSDGKWILPMAIWDMKPYFKFGEGTMEVEHEVRPGSYAVLSDNGVNFREAGVVKTTAPSPDENMVVEKNDGSLWMLIRTRYGIGEAYSYDGGKTWTKMKESSIPSPASRFFIRRMPSGRLLLINHYEFTKRNNLTALLSDDDGKTWPHKLLLDERDNVSYPDAAVRDDGEIIVIYDRERYGNSEILTARITEQEILDGAVTDSDSYLRNVISSRK